MVGVGVEVEVTERLHVVSEVVVEVVVGVEVVVVVGLSE